MSKTISGLLLIIAAQFIPAEEIEIVVEAIGIILAWYGRFVASGDISILGFKK